MGVHVLKEFLDNYNGKAYCAIRDRKNLTAKQRLNILFEFYFSCLPDEKYKGRIEVINVDINSDDAQEKLSAVKADTVINCAACVDYVKNYEFMYKANVETVNNLIDLCLRSNKKLIHVSTISVYGYGNPDKTNYKIAENKLYFGQVFDDSYTATKFTAERNILESIVDKSLDAKIIRLGNLIGRYNDGALQINLASNGFLKTFWAFSKLGLFCEEEVDKQIEFSPINNVADSILKIAKANHNLCIWHSFDVNTISVRSVVDVLKSKGIKLNLVSSDKIIDYYLNNIDGKHKDAKLIALILYPLKYPQYDFFENNNMNPDHSYNVLQKLNFNWPQITEEYLKKLFEYAIGLGYFD